MHNIVSGKYMNQLVINKHKHTLATLIGKCYTHLMIQSDTSHGSRAFVNVLIRMWRNVSTSNNAQMTLATLKSNNSSSLRMREVFLPDH